ncbi:MAG: DUF1579 family protein, partial [Balneolaceae bacterium]
ASYHIIKNTISSFLYNKDLANSIMQAIDKNTWNMQTSNLVWQNLSKIHYDLKPNLHKIIAPTLIIQGRQDALGLENPITISRLIPNSRLIILEKSAHLMWLDRPQKYYQAIGNFLSSSSEFSRLDANHIFSKMEGSKNITAHINTKDGIMKVKGNSSFRLKYKSLAETFSLEIPGETITGKTYIKYSPPYNRFELTQVDNAAGSLIMLNGYWNAKENKLVFRPIKNYSQWGSTGTLKLKWEYEFNDDGSFKKTMLIPDKDGHWVMASDYLYSSPK